MTDRGEHSPGALKRLEGLTALVTDADSDIGGAVAVAFAREGANLGLLCKGNPQVLKQAHAAGQDAAHRIVLLDCDLDSIEEHQRAAELAARELGRIHILVINTPFEWLHHADAKADVTQLERALRTSLETAYQFSLAVAEYMPEGSSIIVTAPMRCAHPAEPVRALVANGQNIATLAANLAHTLAPKRIRANALVPGPVRLPRLLAQLSEDALATFGSETLLGRAAQPAELAPAFVFLAAPAEAGFVNGTTLEVTGGTVVPVPALK